MKPHEVETLPPWCLRLIVLMEARAAPRLVTVEGLWRRGTSARPGTMTEFIRERGLLPPLEIATIVNGAPVALVEFQEVAAQFPIEERPPLREWIDRFNAGVTHLAA
jgi:hypothetical protein